MKLMAIDPGNKQSAFCIYDTDTKEPVHFEIEQNNFLRDEVQRSVADALCIEMVASYGMAVGKTVFETCVWIGRFHEAWLTNHITPVGYIYRKDVKMHLCYSMRAKDSNIRQAIIDRYGDENMAIGGVKCSKCKGKGWFGAGRPTCPRCKGGLWEHPPGPLYGASKDIWSAIAVAMTYAEHKEYADVFKNVCELIKAETEPF